MVLLQISSPTVPPKPLNSADFINTKINVIHLMTNDLTKILFQCFQMFSKWVTTVRRSIPVRLRISNLVEQFAKYMLMHQEFKLY